jgi:hypothetical protein
MICRSPLGKTAVVVALLCIVASGCDSTENDMSSGASGELSSNTPTLSFKGVDVTASVDPQTGVVQFPSDKYATLTLNDQSLLALATRYVESDCAAAAGFSYEPGPSFVDPAYDISEYFGVWTVDAASRFAFAPPMTAGDMRANGIEVDGGFPEAAVKDQGSNFGDLNAAEQKVLQACRKTDEWKQFSPAGLVKAGPWGQPLQDAITTAINSDKAGAVISEYEECLAGKGLEPDPDVAWAAKGANPGEISAEQISLALEVVSCKDQVDFVRRTSDIVADAQAPIIEQYSAELVAQRDRIDEARQKARAFLAERGVTV